MKAKKTKTNYLLTYRIIDKGEFRLTFAFLANLLEEAKNVKKIPLLVLSLKDNNNRHIIAECEIKMREK